MKKLISTICAAFTAAMLTTPALADILPIPFPDPNPEEIVPQIPDVPTVTVTEPQQASMLIPVLVCAVVVIAAAVLARTIIKRRRAL